MSEAGPWSEEGLGRQKQLLDRELYDFTRQLKGGGGGGGVKEI